MALSLAQRIFKVTSLFFLGAVLVTGVVCAEMPSFLSEPIYSPNAASVSDVVASQSADVVVLAGGLEQGLRRGMVCTVSRGLNPVGKIIIIESRSNHSAGLILDLVEDVTIQAGDIARIKTIQNS